MVTRELQLFRDRIEIGFLYGSVIRGDDRPGSDVDLMTVGSLDVFELATAIETMRNALSREVDVTLYAPSEWKGSAYRGRQRKRPLKQLDLTVSGGPGVVAGVRREPRCAVVRTSPVLGILMKLAARAAMQLLVVDCDGAAGRL
ncbi:nucleotidyltransferase domain-containing protein [Rhizobium sp. SIMBA_035]